MYKSYSIKILPFIVLFLLIFTAYSNSFNTTWHLDDRPNIVNNYFLHLDSLHPSELVKTLFTNPNNPEKLRNSPYRPVPCLSFALNWYFGQDNVLGYHIVNTAIHVFTSFFLFLFLVNIFKTPNIKLNYQGNHIIIIALSASILWAINPIQVQAVTYIVQRMAQFAALFYILGMYAYVKGRLTNSFNQRITWFFACFIFYLLAVYSKPNAAMMPMALVLIEIIFFKKPVNKKRDKKTFFILSGTACIILLFGSLLFLNGNPLSFLNSYNARTFTLTERLLAQPRVLLFYLSLIFYPTPDRLSIAHDIILSSSFFKPWTTIPSIVIIVFLIGSALAQIRKRPLLSFSILFFFLNHIIESSVIALEIIFEHRNYLPSFFLFLPVVDLLNNILLTYRNKNKTIYFFTIFFTIFLMANFAFSTFIRNKAWKNDITLWTDAVSKAPNNARAAHILAIELAWGENSDHPKRYDMALQLFEKSLKKHSPSIYTHADILGNMALIYFYKQNNPKKALPFFRKALQTGPGSLKIRHDLTNALIIMKNFEAALKQADILILKNKNNGIYYNLKGHILLWQKKYKDALLCFKKAYELTTDKKSILLNTSVSLNLAGYHEKAEILLIDTIKHYPDCITFYFAIIENSVRAEQKNKTYGYAEKLFKQFDNQTIKHGLEAFTDNPKFAPISKKLIAPVIEDML